MRRRRAGHTTRTRDAVPLREDWPRLSERTRLHATPPLVDWARARRTRSSPKEGWELFDLEITFLFPWAVVLDSLGLYGFIVMLIFLGILVVGFIYEWKKGALDWE